MAEQELLGKVAIVTGAGRLRGIGRAAAVALAQLGCDIVVTGTGRDPESFPPDEKAVNWRDINSTADQVRALGRRCTPMVVDITDEIAVQQMVDETVRELGRIDFLINNAAAARGEDRVSVLDMDPKTFHRVLYVKVYGGLLCTKAVAHQLKRQGEGGRIINLSSVAAPRGTIRTSAYAASNGAIEAATRSWARDLAEYGIRVNAIRPGATDTARMDDWGRGDRWENYQKTIPLGHAATDEQVGRFIAFMCTDTASHITGECINFDGGAYMVP